MSNPQNPQRSDPQISLNITSSAIKENSCGKWIAQCSNREYNKNPSNQFVGMAAFCFILIFSCFWFGGTSITYPGGILKAGDLGQHYVAGLMWNEDRSEDLYRNFEFSKRLAQWRESLSKKEGWEKGSPSNYVYSPIVVRIAALFSHKDISLWIWAWFSIMISTTILGWFLLSRMASGIRFNCFNDWLLLFSFPGIWYAFVANQNSTISFFLISAASLLAAKGFSYTAGAVIACIFYKSQIVFGIGLIMLIARHFRFSIGLISISTALLGIQLLVFGPDLLYAWLQSMRMSMEGKQFVQVGLNQSLRGWLLALFGSRNHYLSWITLSISIALLVTAGVWLRKLEKKKFWQPGFSLLVASALWTVASPYTAHYDFMLILGLWGIA